MSCLDSRSGLFCGADGTLHSMTCGGTGGCAGKGDQATCDNDVAAPGDGCAAANDSACSADHRSLLQCVGGAFARIEACKGPGGCKVGTGAPTCDSDLADVADPCRRGGSFACASDQSGALRCDGGRFVAVQTCRGPKGCGVVHSAPEVSDLDCDFTVAAENDPCAFPGSEACTADKKSMLTCKDGKYGGLTACVSDCSVSVNGKVAKATCDGAASGGGAAASSAWSGTYRCGSEVVRLTQTGSTVSGTIQRGAATDVLTCIISGNACTGTFVGKVASTKPARSPARSLVTLTRQPDGRIGASYPTQPARTTTCSK